VASELDFRHVSAADGDGADSARGLYESEGHVPVGNFNGNPVATFFGDKRLSG
jgi:hypothetical protein